MKTNTLSLSVPERLWLDIFFAPNTGEPVIVKDIKGYIDIAYWYGSCWKTKNNFKEFTKITQFANVPLSEVEEIIKELDNK